MDLQKVKADKLKELTGDYYDTFYINMITMAFNAGAGVVEAYHAKECAECNQKTRVQEAMKYAQ
jgi:hypothetical protein